MLRKVFLALMTGLVAGLTGCGQLPAAAPMMPVAPHPAVATLDARTADLAKQVRDELAKGGAIIENVTVSATDTADRYYFQAQRTEPQTSNGKVVSLVSGYYDAKSHYLQVKRAETITHSPSAMEILKPQIAASLRQQGHSIVLVQDVRPVPFGDAVTFTVQFHRSGSVLTGVFDLKSRIAKLNQ